MEDVYWYVYSTQNIKNIQAVPELVDKCTPLHIPNTYLGEIKLAYLVRYLDNPQQVVRLPHVDIATQSSCIGNIFRAKGETEHGLYVSNFPKHTFFGVQCVAAKAPEFYVFYTTANNHI